MPDWDQVYQSKKVDDAHAAEVLSYNIHLLKQKGGIALDYASGLGGNAVLLAQKNYQVTAWDLSSVAIEKLQEYAKEKNLSIQAEQVDLENSSPCIENQFDVIVVSYFLFRQQLPDLANYLKPGGLLFYQTFSGVQVDSRGPSRKNFRLQRGELLEVFSNMQLLYYREDCCDADNEGCNPDQVCFIAQKIL